MDFRLHITTPLSVRRLQPYFTLKPEGEASLIECARYEYVDFRKKLGESRTHRYDGAPQKSTMRVCACAFCPDVLAEGGDPGRGGRARYFRWKESHRRQQQRQRAFLAQPSCTSGADREHRFDDWIRATRQAESHRPGRQ